MRLFFDTEFTGLHKNTTLISIGIIAENGKSFYAELTDYDKEQVDDWIRENVIKNLKLDADKFHQGSCYDMGSGIKSKEYVKDVNRAIRGTKEEVAKWLKDWIENAFEEEDKLFMVGDVCGFDWVLFCDLFGHAFKIPEKVFYQPLDISTMMYERGIDMDIKRTDFISNDLVGEQHNALFDARVIKDFYKKLTTMDLMLPKCY